MEDNGHLPERDEEESASSDEEVASDPPRRRSVSNVEDEIIYILKSQLCPDMTKLFFSGKELEYLKSQRIARIATVSSEGSLQPDVVPVGFEFDGEAFYLGGFSLLKSRRYKNVLKNNKVAIVIDDLKTVDPWDPRGIRIYGKADIVTRQSGYMEEPPHPQAEYIKIKPEKKWSWGINEPIILPTN